jgi:CRP-like cAMP-binding protein
MEIESLPPKLPGAESCEDYVDHTLMLLLADETEAALRWAAALVARDSSVPAALLVTSRLLEQMGRSKAAMAGLGLALRNAIDAASLPLAVAAIEDLRTLFGVDVRDHLERLASTFCFGSRRLDFERPIEEGPAAPGLRPLSPFLSGPALGSQAAKIVEGAVVASGELVRAEPPRIPPLPLFSALGCDALRDLLGAFEVMTVPVGQRVVEQGKPSDSVYIVARGTLEMERRSAADLPVLVTPLEDGAFFGEMALLSDMPAPSSVIARRPSILLVGRRGALQGVVDRHPEVAAELEAHGRRQLLANLGPLAPALSALQPHERDLVIGRFHTREFEKGERLISFGEDTNGLFVVASGEVAMIARDGNDRVMLATLGAGEMLGEVELVLCRKSEIDAVAVRPTMTLFLPRSEFLALAVERPSLLQCLYMAAIQSNTEARRAMVAPTVLIEANVLDYGAAARPVAAPPVAAPAMAAPAMAAPAVAAPAMAAPRVAVPPNGALPFAAPAMTVRPSAPPPLPVSPPPPAPAPSIHAPRFDAQEATGPSTPRLPPLPPMVTPPPPRVAPSAGPGVEMRTAAGHTMAPASLSPVARSLPAAKGNGGGSRAGQAFAIAAVAGCFVALGVGLPSQWYRPQTLGGAPAGHAAANGTSVTVGSPMPEIATRGPAVEPQPVASASVDVSSAVGAMVVAPRVATSAAAAVQLASVKPRTIAASRIVVAAPVPTSVPTSVPPAPASPTAETSPAAPPQRTASVLSTVVSHPAAPKAERDGQTSAQPASAAEDPDHFGGRD